MARAPTAPGGDCAGRFHRLGRCGTLAALLRRGSRRPGGLFRPWGLTYVALSNTYIIISTPAVARPMTSPRSSWRRRATQTGSAATLMSGSRTSRPCTPNGAPGALQFLTPPKQRQYEKTLLHPRYRTDTSSKSDKPRTQKGTGRPLTGHRVRPPEGACADPLHRLRRCRALSALLHRSTRRQGRLLRKAVRRADQCRTIQRLDRHQRWRWTDGRQADGHPGDATLIPTGSAAS